MFLVVVSGENRAGRATNFRAFSVASVLIGSRETKRAAG